MKDCEFIGICYHEAAHAVLGKLNNHKVKYILVEYNLKENKYPHAHIEFKSDDEIIRFFNEKNLIGLNNIPKESIIETLERYFIGLMAGTISEWKFLEKGKPTLSQINKSDLEPIESYSNTAKKFISPELVNELLGECLKKTYSTVYDKLNWNKIHNVAQYCVKKEGKCISGKEFTVVYRHKYFAYILHCFSQTLSAFGSFFKLKKP